MYYLLQNKFSPIDVIIVKILSLSSSFVSAKNRKRIVKASCGSLNEPAINIITAPKRNLKETTWEAFNGSYLFALFSIFNRS